MIALELWELFKAAIATYTGLSPATFFTVTALGLAIYYLASGLFGSSSDRAGGYRRPGELEEEEIEPLPPPVQVGEITEEELKLYDGSDPKKPLLMAIKSQIYDVSQSRMFYGPGGPYALFAGRDASRALAKMSFEEKDLTGDISGLGVFELDALRDWEYKFMSKYVKVGTVKSGGAPPREGGDDATCGGGAPSGTTNGVDHAAEESQPESSIDHETSSGEKKD